MPSLSLSIPHQLSRADARRKTEELVAQFQQQAAGLGHVQEHWNGDTMDFTVVFMGMPVTGQAQVEDRAVRMEVEMPWLLAKLAGSFQQTLEHQGRQLLGRH